MDTIEMMTRRVSPAKLVEPPPPPPVLEEMLQAAVRAPDHGRLQPWRFVLIEGEARERFGELMAQSLRRREPDATPEKLAAERSKAMRAPLLVVVAAEPRAHPTIPEIEQVMAVAAAAQNIILAAHAGGYGAFWRTGASAYDAGIKDALGLAPGAHIVGFLYVGTIAQPGRERVADATPFVRRWP